MGTDNSAELQSQLKAAHKDLKGGRPQVALEKLKAIQQYSPNNCDVEHLIALSYKSLGDLDRSETHFLNCLRINYKQPEVHNNLANLLKSKANFSEAETHYLQALSLHPNYLQAQRNLAICYQAQANYPAAIAAYRKAVTLSQHDVSAITGMADCLRLSDDLIAAHQAYQKAIMIDPRSLNSWHNWGLNFHLQGQLGKAINCYQKAHEIAPNSPEVVESLAVCLYESGELIAATELFAQALAVDPGNVQLHERFNSMLWESEFADRFGDSYVTAIRRLADSDEVALSYAWMLYHAGRAQRAKSILDANGLHASEHADVLSLRGQIEAELGNFDFAYPLLAKSLGQQFSKGVAQQMVKIDIVLERYSQAQDLLKKMFLDSPDCQLTWALQSLVWRFSGDARYQWLCDYQKFIQIYELEVPSDYNSLDDFLAALRDELNAMHRSEREPLQQTLRNGTQTAARLLHAPSPVLQSLKDCLTSIVTRYIKGLPDDMEHPLLGRKSQQFEFAGSWSVKLSANGFHVNHVHPEGWISSSCYISIPTSMDLSDDVDRPRQGHIKFGESPLQLAGRERVELSLKPEPGMVVLFPSYFWHGTYPFKGGQNDFRMTAPFDVVPR